MTQTRLEAWRKEHGYTIEQASEYVGVDRTWWGRLEARKGRPSGMMRRRLARATGLRPDEVVLPVKERLA